MESNHPERLANLYLLPPAGESPWRNLPHASVDSPTLRRDGETVPIPSPLFWYDPPWIELSESSASLLACCVADLGITTSALRRDFGHDGDASPFFESKPQETDGESGGDETFYPRMTPYRAERFGLLPEDFDDTLVVDLRLAPTRDPSGRYAYSHHQMKRWERGANEESIAGGGSVACASFPADVISPKQARIKVEQLRKLAPAAAVMVSVDAFHLKSSLSSALLAKPDGIILRVDAPEWSGLQLVSIVRRARQFLKEHSTRFRPLWIVPGAVSVRDVAKLIALGADAVAIDHWCKPLVHASIEHSHRQNYEPIPIHEIQSLAFNDLWPDVDHAFGLISSVRDRADATLATSDREWSEATGAELISN